jgi:hypothetical protein
MWDKAQQDALTSAVLALSHRYEIDELLGRVYRLRAVESEHGVEYSGPELGGWLRIRFHEERAISANFIERS